MNTDILPPADPWLLFASWFALAKQHEPSYPDAMILATLGVSGMPTARTVLMKDYNAEGIVFYTNKESRKGHELAAHPFAGVCFYWKSLLRQIRIEGSITHVSEAESDTYFATRPRGSQIGAWASLQSQVYETRAIFEQRVRDVEKEYEGREVVRPPHWGGYRLVPATFEFWQERQYRLHDRVRYTRLQGVEAWLIERLFP